MARSRRRVQSQPEPKESLALRAITLVIAAVVACGIGAWVLWFSGKSSDVPPEVEQQAINVVEQQYSVSGVTVLSEARSGSCAIVKVHRPDTTDAGPSVSLDEQDGIWQVRRVSDAFDPDSIANGGACP